MNSTTQPSMALSIADNSKVMAVYNQACCIYFTWGCQDQWVWGPRTSVPVLSSITKAILYQWSTTKTSLPSKLNSFELFKGANSVQLHDSACAIQVKLRQSRKMCSQQEVVAAAIPWLTTEYQTKVIHEKSQGNMSWIRFTFKSLIKSVWVNTYKMRTVAEEVHVDHKRNSKNDLQQPTRIGSILSVEMWAMSKMPIQEKEITMIQTTN